MYLRTINICFGLLCMVSSIDGHGRLIDPPSRVSAWRYGFKTPKEYTDNQFNCGGHSRQWNSNGGRCGVCGDAWDITPRPGEAGGRFATGTIVKTYSAGEMIQVSVDITANHLGYLEYKLCPVTNPSVPVTQDCLDQTPLPISDGSGYKFDIGRKRGIIKVQLQLPENFACEHCVLQWRYRGGNNWGHCEGGGGKQGCGPQEEFRACADISISNNGGANPRSVGISTKSPNVVTTKAVNSVTTADANVITTTVAGPITEGEDANVITTTVAGPITEGDCSSSSTGYIRHPTNCSRFYRCVHGKKKPFVCPSGQAFNPAINVCDWSYNVPGCYWQRSHIT